MRRALVKTLWRLLEKERILFFDPHLDFNRFLAANSRILLTFLPPPELIG